MKISFKIILLFLALSAKLYGSTNSGGNLACSETSEDFGGGSHGGYTVEIQDVDF